MELNQEMGDHQTEMAGILRFAGSAGGSGLRHPGTGKTGIRPGSSEAAREWLAPRPIKVGAIQHKLGVVWCCHMCDDRLTM